MIWFFKKKLKNRNRLEEFNDSIFSITIRLKSSVFGYHKVTYSIDDGLNYICLNEKDAQAQYAVEAIVKNKKLKFVELIRFCKRNNFPYRIDRIGRIK